MDNQSDGFKNVSPFTCGHFWYLCQISGPNSSKLLIAIFYPPANQHWKMKLIDSKLPFQGCLLLVLGSVPFWVIDTVDGRHAAPGMCKTLVICGTNYLLTGEPDFWTINSSKFTSENWQATFSINLTSTSTTLIHWQRRLPFPIAIGFLRSGWWFPYTLP